MTEQAQASSASVLDTAKLVAAVAILVAGIASFYVFDQYPAAARWLVVLVAVAAGIFVALQSAQGRELWQFVQGSRVELRKVVWPTQEETRKMTLVVVVAILIMAIFFWGLDMILGWITRTLTGQGG
ncbi:MAG: preprotein translocase subunit SecE [Steroidobacteraceae bacterium]|nr:preprotein translocase subunit SecE [Steroidobacteraceae bacterium]